MRTLYLSDFSAPFYFVQLHAKVGNVNYTVVGSRTITSFGSVDNQLKDQGRPGNLLVFHYVSWQATRWLKLGAFENNMYNMEVNGGVQPGMLNPFIFNRGMSQNVGNSGKSSIGLDAKANIGGHVQFYSQILINEFVLSKVFDFGRSSWRNKHGLQIGGKYIDAFTVKNLDLQVEYNAVRPFTYTDKWLINNFAHDNLPLAHPLGANFHELIGVVHYQPLKRLYLTGTVIGYRKGLDSASYKTASTQQNFGGDIFRSYEDGNSYQNVAIGDGIPVSGLLGQLKASYEVSPGLFLDGNITFRKYDISGQPNNHIRYFNLGIRWNMTGRNFLF